MPPPVLCRTRSRYPWVTPRRALLALCLLFAPSPVAFAASDGQARVEAEFGRICQRLKASNDYFGEAQLEAARTAYDQAQASAAAGDPQTLERLTAARNQLAYHLVRLDRAAELLALYESLPALGPADAMSAGIAHLTLAEDRNCLLVHGGGACVLPLIESAVHRDPTHARSAAQRFRQVLETHPDDVQARWLLQLAHTLAGGDPSEVEAPRRRDGQAAVARTRRPDAAGRTSHPWLDVAHRLGVRGEDLAGGAVVDDFDGDGRLDLITSTMDPCGPLRAWRNEGTGFVDVGDAWGLSPQLGGLNLVHADYDGDGALDLLVLRGGWMGDDGRIRNSLLRNDLATSGRFVDVTVEAGLAQPAYPTQAAAWADIDRDGDLDLFIANESPAGSADPLSLTGREERGFPSQLFLNLGSGRFRDVARQAGVQNLSYAKGAAWGDYDDDGDPDLYVSNIGANRLYRNDGIGGDGAPRFVDVAPELGVDSRERTFATWWFDFDQDGDLDLFVARYSSSVEEVTGDLLGLQRAPTAAAGEPLLYRNDVATGGGFVEVGRQLGFDSTLLPMGANFGDLDSDGWPDLYLGTGVPRFDGLMPNVAYRNLGGLRFEDVTWETGLGHLQKGHGVAFGDLDNDGDEDLFEQLGGAFPYDGFSNALYLNPTLGAPGAEGGEPAPHWLTLQLHSPGANRHAVGARVRLVLQDGERQRTLHAEVTSGGSFGGSSLQLELGLGTASRIERLEVAWPDDLGPVSTVYTGLLADRAYRVERGAAAGEAALHELRRPRVEFALRPSHDSDTAERHDHR